MRIRPFLLALLALAAGACAAPSDSGARGGATPPPRAAPAAGPDPRRFDVSYPLANDASGRTWARWRVPYQPVTVLVDKQGRIAERFDGGTTGGTLRAALSYLVDE